MSVAKIHYHKGVTFFELGYSFLTKPFINVMSYYIDGLLIDTGPHKMRKHLFKLLKEYPVQKVALTHYHEDHSGNAEFLRQKLNVPIFTSKKTAEIVTKSFYLHPYQVQIFGKAPKVQEVKTFDNLIETKHHSFQIIFTPGHSTDHYVFLEKEKAWLFSGDLYLGKLKYMRSEENIREMIASLKKILKYDFEVLFCAHRPKLKNGKKYIKEKLEYLENFYGEVSRLYKKGFSSKAIMKELQIKEMYLIKLWTSFDVSVENMVKSVIFSEENKFKNSTRGGT